MILYVCMSVCLYVCMLVSTCFLILEEYRKFNKLMTLVLDRMNDSQHVCTLLVIVGSYCLHSPEATNTYTS